MATLVQNRMGRNGRNVCVAVSRLALEVIEMNILFAQHEFRMIVAGCWIVSAAVWLHSDLTANSSPACRRLYRANAAINGAASMLLLMYLGYCL